MDRQGNSGQSAVKKKVGEKLKEVSSTSGLFAYAFRTRVLYAVGHVFIRKQVQREELYKRAAAGF